jgi:hypothetical protein
MATNGNSKVVSVDRRLVRDRREHDDAPAVNWERRRGIEPRKPEVVELEMTPSQWDALLGSATQASPGTPNGKT